MENKKSVILPYHEHEQMLSLIKNQSDTITAIIKAQEDSGSVLRITTQNDPYRRPDYYTYSLIIGPENVIKDMNDQVETLKGWVKQYQDCYNGVTKKVQENKKQEDRKWWQIF